MLTIDFPTPSHPQAIHRGRVVAEVQDRWRQAGDQSGDIDSGEGGAHSSPSPAGAGASRSRPGERRTGDGVLQAAARGGILHAWTAGALREAGRDPQATAAGGRERTGGAGAASATATKGTEREVDPEHPG